MGIKVTTNLNLTGIPRSIKKEFLRVNSEKRAVEAAIIEEIVQGRSPVKGEKWKDYSDGYAKKKGRKKPVDMAESGKLINSLKARKHGNGDVSIAFRGQAQLAKYHDVLGAGKSKVVRRLLPRKAGEEFKRKVQKTIDEMMNRAILRVVTKANR